MALYGSDPKQVGVALFESVSWSLVCFYLYCHSQMVARQEKHWPTFTKFLLPRCILIFNYTHLTTNTVVCACECFPHSWVFNISFFYTYFAYSCFNFRACVPASLHKPFPSNCLKLMVQSGAKRSKWVAHHGNYTRIQQLSSHQHIQLFFLKALTFEGKKLL